MFRVSSKRINMMESAKPSPAVRSASATPTTRTRGRVHASGWPEIKQTIARGNIPIKKFVRPAKAEEIAKI